MADRIQLKDPGSELVMTVTAVRPEIVEKNEYYLFTNGHKELLVPQSTMKTELPKMSLGSVDQLIGKTVKFARSLKMSRANKPYWDVSLASGAEQAPVPSAGVGGNASNSASAAPADPAPAKPKLRDAYKSLTEWVLTEIEPIYRQHDFDFPADVAAACVQTLFIQACYAGKVE